MPRKKLRKPKPKGRHKNRKTLWEQHLEAIKGRLSVTDASTPASYHNHVLAHSRIMQGRHPNTGQPLPVNEDGAEYLP